MFQKFIVVSENGQGGERATIEVMPTKSDCFATSNASCIAVSVCHIFHDAGFAVYEVKQTSIGGFENPQHYDVLTDRFTGEWRTRPVASNTRRMNAAKATALIPEHYRHIAKIVA